MTQLTRISVATCHDALRSFGEKHNGEESPIVCVPSSAGFPFVSIPHGVFALKSNKGVLDDEPLTPGFHFMAPWEWVAYVISPQFTMFDIPIKECPTKDNMMVKIDVILMFRILQPKQFIINLGPEKLSTQLKSALEEAVRSIAQTSLHSQIYDLVRFDEASIIADMDKRFQPYGVEISNIMITDVKLPGPVAQRLEHETTFQSKNREQKKRQEFDLLKTRHASELNQKKLEYKNTQLAFEEESKKKVSFVSKEVDEINARTQKQIAEINETTKRSTALIKEQAKRVASGFHARKEASLLELRTKAQATCSDLQTEQHTYTQEVLSKTELTVAENRAKVIKLVGDQEAVAAKKLKEKRKQTIGMSSLDVLQSLSDNDQVVVAGSTNGNLIAQVAASQAQRQLYGIDNEQQQYHDHSKKKNHQSMQQVYQQQPQEQPAQQIPPQQRAPQAPRQQQ